MALILLVGASLFVRSFLNLQSASPGFDTTPLLTARFFMVRRQLRDRRSEGAARRGRRAPHRSAAGSRERVRVELRAARCRRRQRPRIVDGRAFPAGEEPTILFTAVTPHLYKTMGMPLLKGRDFTDGEGLGKTPVAVINETMAKKLWPGSDAVGRRFRLVERDPAEWFTVIGVGPDIRMFDIGRRHAGFLRRLRPVSLLRLCQHRRHDSRRR